MVLVYPDPAIFLYGSGSATLLSGIADKSLSVRQELQVLGTGTFSFYVPVGATGATRHHYFT